MVCPVNLAQTKIASAAILNRIAAVVKTPRPLNAILMATAFEPKIAHKNTDNMPAINVKTGLSEGCFGMDFASQKIQRNINLKIER